jgi:transposase
LGPAEQRRAYVLNEVLAGALSVAKAAQVLGLSERQVQRPKVNYKRAGAAALVHANRGRPPWNQLAPEVRTRVVDLARTRYPRFNQPHLTEKVAQDEHLHLDRSTVLRMLLEAGVRSPTQCRAPRHRQRRERMPREGMLL